MGHLYGERLHRVYEIAPPRVRQYLEAEIQYVIHEIAGVHSVLELGCGYGRVLKAVQPHVEEVIGIDTSLKTLAYGRTYLSGVPVQLLGMDASELGFTSRVVDAVLCIQNGLSAFHVDSNKVITEAIRVTRPGGLLLFSSYSPNFWDHRLEWFRLQSREGLVGEIDDSRTKVGKIVCKDGFTATVIGEKQFLKLFGRKEVKAEIVEIDGSSVFCRAEVL